MFSFDDKVSSKLDSWIDGYPGRIFVATLFAKYVVWAFLGSAMVAYQLITGVREGYTLYLIALFLIVGAPYLFSVALSFLIRRKRPYEHVPDAWHLPLRVYTPSFPSGHSTIAFAIFAFLLIYWQPAFPLAVLLFLIASAVALARVLVGVHYVSDVIAGAFIGAVGGWVVFKIAEDVLLFLWR